MVYRFSQNNSTVKHSGSSAVSRETALRPLATCKNESGGCSSGLQGVVALGSNPHGILEGGSTDLSRTGKGSGPCPTFVRTVHVLSIRTCYDYHICHILVLQQGQSCSSPFEQSCIWGTGMMKYSWKASLFPAVGLLLAWTTSLPDLAGKSLSLP